MPRQGDDFHKLVEHLERVLAREKDITIESPKLMPDKITGDDREHDIVITYKEGHRKLVVALECRDRGVKVGVGQVEEFKNKCQDTGIDKGIIVSSKGFWATTLKKAEAYGIDCLTLKQIEKVDWCNMVNINLLHRHVTQSIILVKGIEDIQEGWKLFYKPVEGEEEDVTNNINFILQVMEQVPFEQPSLDQTKITIDVKNPEAFSILGVDGKRYPVTEVKIVVWYKMIEMSQPMRFVNYSQGDTTISSSAISDFEFGDHVKGRLLLSKNGNDVQLSVITENPASNNKKNGKKTRKTQS